ncbi:MAG: hypothetical protein GX757_12095, partial [Clostridiales bacterium]|nr:hypothetical protein [Clostridiales bacterium]
MKENELRGILKRPQPDSSMDRRIAENILKYNVNHANNRQRAAVIYNKFIKNSFVGLTCAISAAAIILVLAGGIISRFSQVRQDDRENIQKNVQTSPANGTKAGDEIS